MKKILLVLLGISMFSYAKLGDVIVKGGLYVGVTPNDIKNEENKTIETRHGQPALDIQLDYLHPVHRNGRLHTKVGATTEVSLGGDFYRKTDNNPKLETKSSFAYGVSVMANAKVSYELNEKIDLFIGARAGLGILGFKGSENTTLFTIPADAYVGVEYDKIVVEGSVGVQMVPNKLNRTYINGKLTVGYQLNKY